MTATVNTANRDGTGKLPYGFARLWAGETLSSTGMQITAIAIPIIVIAELGASAAQVTLLSMTESLAVILFGLLGGTAADLVNRRRLLIVSNLLRAAVIVLIPASFYFGFESLPLILGVVFVTAGLGVLFDSAMSGYIRDLVPTPLLVRANGYMQATQSTGEVGGPSLAGVLVALVSAPWAIVLDALSYLTSAAFLASTPASPSPRRVATRTRRPPLNKIWRACRRTVTSGTRIVWNTPAVRATTASATHFNFFTSMFFALYLFHLVSSLQLSPFTLGLVFTGGGLGGILAGVVVSRITSRISTNTLLIATFGIPGLAAVAVASTHTETAGTVTLLVAASALWSFCVVVNISLCESIKQVAVRSHHLGRTTATVRAISWGVELLGAALAGLLTSLAALAPTTIMSWAATGLLTSGIWVVFARSHITRNDVRTS